MAQQFQEQILFQARPSTTDDTFVWQCPQFYTAVIHTIVIANVTANAITYRLFANPSGKTFTVNNSLAYNVALAGSASDSWVSLGGITYPASFGVRTNTASSLVITCFGTLMKTG